jgi:2-polyprenyl-6-hydroxyphenyl methylase/3-demethylubiquinone-9 3-methyltransferase
VSKNIPLSTKDDFEIKKFDNLASKWWDIDGEFKLLHVINPLRIGYIKAHVCKAFGLDTSTKKPFKGLKFLDIGCGGGLISVPMYNLGASITGVDASFNNIKIAKAYAKRKALDINFAHTTVEELAAHEEKFDVVLSLEVIEHVADYKLFLDKLISLLSPDGILILSTINRTFKSMVLAKIAAEYILRMVPIGTHDWNKFIKPEEIEEELGKRNLNRFNISGMTMNPFTFEWDLSNDVSVNYLVGYRRKDQ